VERVLSFSVCLLAIACGARTGLSSDDGGHAVASRDAGWAQDALVPPIPACRNFGDEAVTLISVALGGGASIGNAASPEISSDGRLVAFVSEAEDLVDGDRNEQLDVFVFDRFDRTMRRVSVASDGTEGDDASGFRLMTGRPTFSGDGDLVAFPSNSDRLHPDDTDGRTTIYVHSLERRDTRRVVLPTEFAQFVGGDTPRLASNGRYLAFSTLLRGWAGDDSVGAFQVMRADLSTGTVVPISVAADGTFADTADDLLAVGVPITARVVDLSADGRYVAFASGSQNLDGTTPDMKADVFVRDVESGTTERVSVNNEGEPANERSMGPALSGNGRIVAFNSGSTNLAAERTSVFVRDLDLGVTEAVPDAAGYPGLSSDARFVTFVRGEGVFVYDRVRREAREVDVGTPAEDEYRQDPRISADGCWIALCWRGQIYAAQNPFVAE
jgi:Tol biopolymer transport system component